MTDLEDIAAYDFELPDDRIAKTPTEPRDASRLMLIDRATGSISHHIFRELPDLLRAEDGLVVNNTKVMKARIHTTKESGGRVEVLLVEPSQDGRFKAMFRPAKKVRLGTKLRAVREPSVELEVSSDIIDGFGEVRLPAEVESVTEQSGELPLPPYMGRQPKAEDDRRYQTVYAQKMGSVAAPTAGLHFTDDVFARLSAKGILRGSLTLHVGPGTFLPVRVAKLAEHVMHEEAFAVSDELVETHRTIRARGGRVVAVGTTSTRVLESFSDGLQAGNGRTNIFIRPGFDFKNLDGLITNFHLPRSTLLMLVSAFAGRELILRAYEEAKTVGYRFYSYGDAMLIL